MFSFMLSSLSERLEMTFLTSAWLPAFFAAFANVGLLALLIGTSPISDWLYSLGTDDLTVAVLLVLVIITGLATFLRALSLVTVGLFSGELFPKRVAAWATGFQRQAWSREQSRLANRRFAHPLREQVRSLVEQQYPQDESEVRPTRLGNMIAATVEYPWIVYGMDGMLWWPQLALLLPTEPVDVGYAISGAQSRLMSLLNYSLICGVVAVEGIVLLGLVGHRWVAAFGWAIAAVVLGWLAYHAAVSQSMEVSTQIRSAFNLYRQLILEKIGVDKPDTLVAERALWQTLSKEMLGQSAEAAPNGESTETAGSTDGRTEMAAAHSGNKRRTRR
jgi:hypothetical protein